MGTKKKGASGKRIVMRIDPNAAPKSEADEKNKEKEKSAEPDILEMRRQGREKNEGFGVIKTVAGVIIVLIFGSMILFNRSGARDKVRGDKPPGATCSETVECASGSICYSYKGLERRCLVTCGGNKQCPSGTKCISATEQKRRKGLRVTDVCVEDALLK